MNYKDRAFHRWEIQVLKVKSHKVIIQSRLVQVSQCTAVSTLIIAWRLTLAQKSNCPHIQHHKSYDCCILLVWLQTKHVYMIMCDTYAICLCYGIYHLYNYRLYSNYVMICKGKPQSLVLTNIHVDRYLSHTELGKFYFLKPRLNINGILIFFKLRASWISHINCLGHS